MPLDSLHGLYLDELKDSYMEVMAEDGDPAVIDATLIAAQRVEHNEMAGYGCARPFATLPGHMDAAELLQGTLAETVINVDAQDAAGDDEATPEAGRRPARA